jgi:UPF0755 protein
MINPGHAWRCPDLLRYLAAVRKLFVSIVVLLLVAAGAVAGAALLAWRELDRPQPLPAAGVVVSVTPGDHFRTVANRLQAAGIVRHGWLLSLWARVNALDRQVRHGDYRFEHALTPIEVLDLLRSPLAALHRVTIPEGSTVEQVATIWAAQGFGGADAFMLAARDPNLLADLDLPASGVEGYLFPDTYAAQWSDSPAEIIRRMVVRFRAVASELDLRRRQRDTSVQAWVTLASIVEKETGAPSERALVAAVFLNRLRLHWPLQSDPTVIYGIEAFDGNLTKAQLRQPTRYNTYTIPGLPPGPICNPGRAALAAVVQPAAVDYLYFVARGDGTHQFSVTLTEHNRAVDRFQRK